MSFVIAAPDLMAEASVNLSSIGSAIGAANAAAAAPTEAVLAAGADEVSAAVAALFGAHAQSYQALGAQAAAFHDQFVQALTAGAGSYAATEAASASPIQALLNAINAPFLTALGRPLIGNGADGAAGTGAAGGAGGLLAPTNPPASCSRAGSCRARSCAMASRRCGLTRRTTRARTARDGRGVDSSAACGSRSTDRGACARTSARIPGRRQTGWR